MVSVTGKCQKHMAEDDLWVTLKEAWEQKAEMLLQG